MGSLPENEEKKIKEEHQNGLPPKTHTSHGAPPSPSDRARWQREELFQAAMDLFLTGTRVSQKAPFGVVLFVGLEGLLQIEDISFSQSAHTLFHY